MVRRVGFGDGASGRRDGPDPVAATPEAADAAAPPEAGRTARFLLVLFLLAWLAVWSWGIWHAFTALAGTWSGMQGGGGAWDWGTVAFLGAWLIFALVGWAFGVVVAVVLLFGKPMTEERRREKAARREARRQARAERRG